MKKELIIVTASLMLTGCSSGIPQESYEAVSEAASIAESEKESLQSNLSALKDVYLNYRESMAEYEGLAAAEAEARKIEAESIAAEASAAAQASKEAEEAAAQASREAEEASRAAEEAKGYETGITYDQLARTPDDYQGQKVKFTGTVLQVLEGSFQNEMRLATNGSYDDVVYVIYDPSIVSSRILEDDTITVYGTASGLKTYTSTLGAQITLPKINAAKIDQ